MGFFSFLAPLFAGLGGGTGIGNLLTGAAGLISANKSAKAQGVDFQKLRDDATAAGFNPLTALMAGGTGGYQRQVAPALASSAFIADALGRVIDTGFNGVKQEDTLAKSVREANAYAERSLAERAKQLPRPFGYALTTPQPFGLLGAGNGSVSASSVSGGTVGGVPLRVAGVDVVQNDNFSNAQAIEDRYGDVVSSVYGATTLAADAKTTFKPHGGFLGMAASGFEDMARDFGSASFFKKKPKFLPSAFSGLDSLTGSRPAMRFK